MARDIVLASRPISPTLDQSCSEFFEEDKKKGARTSRPVLSSVLGKGLKLGGKMGAKPADAKLAAAEPAYKSKSEPNLYSGAALIYTGVCAVCCCCCCRCARRIHQPSCEVCLACFSKSCVCLSSHPCVLRYRLDRQWSWNAQCLTHLTPLCAACCIQAP